MKKLFAGILAVTLVGCSPPQADDNSTPPPVVAAAPTSPTPKPGDWMWQKSGTQPSSQKNNWSLNSQGPLKNDKNPLGITDDPLNQKAKAH